MVFSSLNFLFIFLPVVLVIYFLVPFRAKNAVLLIASIVFYAWGEPVYVILMILNIAFNYVAGLRFESSGNGAERKRHLIIAVAVNLLMLGFFKYSGLFVNTIGSILGINIVWREIGLPIGISFYTFQALSYIIDAYKGKVRVQHNIIDFATYITMFPQLIAGPIVTYSEVEWQLKKRRVSPVMAGQGVERLILGLAKKVILANNLGALYQAVQLTGERSVMLAWLGGIAYTLQIYFDFSGYSDMAIGMGKMLGFKFPENFDHPYLATSITDFWRRWHMTLSGWFRNYVYIPLGGNRKGTARHIINIMIVWMLTGLWHGAGWNFVLWGVFYGVILILEKYLLIPLFGNISKALKHIYTLLIVCMGWVIFSNTDFSAMSSYLGNMIGVGARGFLDSAFIYYLKSNLILLILSFLAAGKIFRRLLNRLSKRSAASCLVLVALFIISVSFLVYGSYNPFLYFRF